MKKILIFAALGAAIAFSSCSGSGNASDSGLDSLFSKGKADTLMMTSAQFYGVMLQNQYDKAMQSDSTLNKEDFIRGVKYAFNADTCKSFMYGVQTGMQLSVTCNQWHQNGLQPDRDKFILAFCKSFNDSISPEEFAELQSVNTTLNAEYQRALVAYEQAKKDASPESQANIAAGIAYIDSLSQANPNVKVSGSGLAYDIIEAGAEPKIQETDMVKMYYTTKTLDGRVIDRMDDNNLRPVSVRGRVEGLRQGLQMLGVGGKAIFVVPGKLAYGTDTRRFNLSPNQPLIMEVEVIEVENR